jgi:hypothetical protein
VALELEDAPHTGDAVENDRLRRDVGRERLHLCAQLRVHLSLEEQRAIIRVEEVSQKNTLYQTTANLSARHWTRPFPQSYRPEQPNGRREMCRRWTSV